MTPETFKIEVLPMKHKLFRFANRLMKNTPESQDIVQEVFIRLWERRHKLKEYRNLEAFAITITKNLCLDKLKSNKHKTDELTSINEEIDTTTPYLKMEMNDSFKRVNQVIGKLPEQQRMIIQLRDVEGYEFSEIEEILGISQNTIRVNLSRARKFVRESMIKNYDYEYTKN